MKYKEGDKVKVALKGKGYVGAMMRTFEKNNVVEIIFINENKKDYKVRDYLGHLWWVREKDVLGLDNQCGYFIS